MAPKRTQTGPDPLLVDLLSLPTAPFCEGYVIDYLRRFCEKRRLSFDTDQAGNVLIHLRRGPKRYRHPVCFAGHLDHPGFVADKMIGPRKLRARWLGGVHAEYFVGSRVRFFDHGDWIRGTVRSISPPARKKRRPVETATIDIAAPVSPHSPGMWDFPDPTIKGNCIYARACDDVAGVAAMLSCIDRLRRKKNAEAYFLFTRAEEVGFVGAISAARDRTIPDQCVVVAVETSSQLPAARIGDGPILRVGDKSSVFTPSATAYCNRVAKELAETDKHFIYQRKLMDGGTCESTAYCQFGYDATGLCIALGNYHNMDTKRRRIAPEFIDLTDYENLVRWFVALATSSSTYDGKDAALIKRLRNLERRYAKLLKESERRL
ncbi:MAG: M20/M25/M40 family metallo-hydrolase [Planctomycetes bacterium]|nr:M20/M25/M40 family metallo-hydrolase [Planctomycetota bacterium]